MIRSALDMLLMHYAAGSLEPAESLLAAAHVHLNPEARRKVAAYEAVGGRLMDDMPETKVSEGCLDKVLRMIDGLCDSACAEKAARADGNDGKLSLPDSIHALLKSHCEDFVLSWETAEDGIELIDLHICTSTPCTRKLFLMRAEPHRAAAAHMHEGIEITVVLNGSYRDEQGRYQAGDIIIIDDPALTHAPMAEDAGCLCLILVDGCQHS